MKYKNQKLKTRRLILMPMTEDELVSTIDSCDDEELEKAYREMLELAKANENNWEWYVPWKMVEKSTQNVIGDIGFKGPEKDNAVEIGYGINKEFEGQGYTTEAAKELTTWALSQPGVYIIEAETAPDNKASQGVLEKLSFEPDGEGEEGPRFILKKAPTYYTTFLLCIGMSCGMAVGVSLHNMSIGMCLGMGIGVMLGAALDSSEKKKMSEILTKRETTKQKQL